MAIKLKKLNFSIVYKVIGLLLIIEGIIMSLSMIVTAIYGDYSLDLANLFNPRYDFLALLVSVIITICSGLLLFFMNKQDDVTMGKHEGFLIVVLSWIFMSLFGTLPYIFSGTLSSFTDAFLESMSGFTTTGLTNIEDVDCMARGVLFWRGMTHWIGGFGIIFFSIAFLPILGVGGYLLITIESTGLMPTKLHPRIKETAKRLMAIYILLTLACAVALYFGGMNWYDAIFHAFSSISTGGFSTYNSSAQFFSPLIQYILAIFMLISAVSFSSLYYFFTFKFSKRKTYEELKVFLMIIIIVTFYVFISLLLSSDNIGIKIEKLFRDSLFQVVSIITTTGLVSVNYLDWHSSIWFIIFLLCFVGGCTGSTSGGIKVVRYIMLFKNCRLEIRRQLHPQAVLPVKYNGLPVQQSTIYSVQAFFVFYLLVFIAGVIMLAIIGLDFETSIGASIASLSNVGPSIGNVGPVDNFVSFPKIGKWVISILMLLGRLELFPVLIIFNKAFWTK